MQPCRATHGLLQLIGSDRLAQVAERAFLDRAHGGLQSRVAGAENHRHVEVEIAHRSQELDAVHAGHGDIAQDHVVGFCAEALDGAKAIGRGVDRETVLGEDLRVDRQHVGVIVHHQHAGGARLIDPAARIAWCRARRIGSLGHVHPRRTVA